MKGDLKCDKKEAQYFAFVQFSTTLFIVVLFLNKDGSNNPPDEAQFIQQQNSNLFYIPCILWAKFSLLVAKLYVTLIME